MDQEKNGTAYYSRRTYRIISGVFGAFLCAVGIAVLYFAYLDGGYGWIVGPAVAVLGFNLVWSALLGREPWFSRIGPLP
ncbi:MAG: hypothetical protein K1X52_07800 [Pyrinomonadaceae bacterium]|nr:hypothetical protein [Pyrinomonadaceae bacterium]